MDQVTTDLGALGEAVVFLEYFKELPDRRQRGKVVYPLDKVLLLALLAVLAGADGFTDIARFGVKKLDLLRRFRPFADGTPPHDTLGDIFASLDPHAFQRCFCQLGRGHDQNTGRGHCDRRQDLAPFLSKEGSKRADPHGLGFCRPPASGARAGQGQ